MLTREEGERLAAAVSALRPDWPTASLLTFIKQRAHRPLLDLSVELVWVAQLGPERAKTPGLIDQDGPWKAVTLAKVDGQSLDAIDFGTACRECLKPFEHLWHGGTGTVNDHEYVKPTEAAPAPRPKENA